MKKMKKIELDKSQDGPKLLKQNLNISKLTDKKKPKFRLASQSKESDKKAIMINQLLIKQQ